MKNEPAAFLSVVWPDGDVFVDIAVSRRNWSRIARGQAVTIRGKGYWYEGRFFWDYWDFSDGLDGTLIVRYGSPKDGDYSGQGFIGTPREALMEEKSERLELDQWEATHFADTVRAWKKNLERAIGCRLTDDDVYRIAQVAQVYEQFRTIKHTRARHKVCERIEKAVDQLILALGEAEPHRIDLGSSSVERERLIRSLKRIRSKAKRHAKLIAAGIKTNRPRNELLRDVVAAALAPYRRSGNEEVGVYRAEGAGEYRGPVFEIVKLALLTAGIKERELPSGKTVMNVVRELDGEIT